MARVRVGARVRVRVRVRVRGRGRVRVRVRVSVSPGRPPPHVCQGEFNRLARLEWNFRDSTGLSDPALFHSYKNKVVGGVLPLALFSGGHNYFVSQFAQRNGWEHGPAPSRHRLPYP